MPLCVSGLGGFSHEEVLETSGWLTLCTMKNKKEKKESEVQTKEKKILGAHL